MKQFWKYFVENTKQIMQDLKGRDKEKKRKQIPNILTLIRGIVAPITIIPAVLTENIIFAFIMIAICSLTDSFDGWYARNYDAQSEFGALLDAICDKLFVVTLAFPLVFKYTQWIITILILEIIISIINTYAKLKGYVTQSSVTGKIKTFVLDTSIALCYLDFIVPVHKIILAIATVLTNLMQILSIGGYYKNCREQRIEKVATQA